MFSIIRRSQPRKSGAVNGFVFLLLIAFSFPAQAVDVPDRLKAAYLFNFAKLTYWPDAEAQAGDAVSEQLVICTLASEELTQALKDVSEKPVGGRPVQVVSLGLRSRADYCHMVFVDEEHTASWFAAKDQHRQRLLLVGETQGFNDRGGVINFFLEGDKLRFEISLKNAQTRQVQLSSRLLKLARVSGGKP